MSRRGLTLLGLAVAAVFLWSAWRPRDSFTWFLEVFPVLLGGPLLFFTRRRFPLTPIVYFLIAVHMILLCIGGHYTYAEVPLFNWLRDQLGLARNHYDRVGHFAQGFVPAMIAREILLRRSAVRPAWLPFTVISFCLALSACYELIEWGAALAVGGAAEAFLGTQGDPWDTQSDMFLALLGSVAALLLLSRRHDRALSRPATVEISS
jgi:putative membrane protein